MKKIKNNPQFKISPQSPQIPQWRSQDFGWLGEASDKISSKVARISVRGGDIQQKFSQQRLLKNLYKIRTKLKKSLQNLSRTKLIKYKKNLRNFKLFL